MAHMDDHSQISGSEADYNMSRLGMMAKTRIGIPDTHAYDFAHRDPKQLQESERSGSVADI